MLGRVHSFPAFASAGLQILLTIGFVCLAGAAYTWNRDSVFFAGNVYFADGDSYARMTRVHLVEQSPLLQLRHHGFENFPDGTRPHTTAPLDYLILLLHSPLVPLTENALSVAGAFISPILGMVTALFLVSWSLALKIPFRWAMLVAFAFSPITAHAFAMGRPDHQSLILALVAVALAAEVSIARKGGRVWAYVSALSWALALWVSLFEPLILLAIVLITRAIRWRWDPSSRKNARVDAHPVERFGPVIVFLIVLAAALCWEGWPTISYDPAFARWAKNIGELRGVTPLVLLGWGGGMVVGAPAFLILGYWRQRDPMFLLWLGILLLVGGLTFVHGRWAYFFVLVLAMSLPWALSAFRSSAFAGMLFIVSLWPVASAWENTLYPDDTTFRARVENLADAVALRDAAIHITFLPDRGVLAPWWFSPAVVWWSGQSAVGGSSHQSLPGISDSARFYLETDPHVAESILRKRKVGHVIAYEPDRVEGNSAQILGTVPSPDAMGRILYSSPKSAPHFLEPIYSNRFFRVFRVREE
jgi:hypothetical protein